MKIGILTWFMGMNYGAQAQTYALSHFLQSRGYDCCEIAFYPKGYKMTNLKMSMAIEKDWYRHPQQCLYSLRRMENFSKFIKGHKLSAPVRTAGEIDDLKLDAIVIGSDELANCLHPFHNEIYFGTGIVKTPVMLYAPSSGAMETTYVLSSDARLSLRNMKFISGRDENTCRILQNNGGQNVRRVVDPTMLYSFEEFSDAIKLNNYILLYSFDSFDPHKKEILKYAREHSLSILSIGRYYEWANRSLPYASEDEWLSSFKHAALVITDSFHGLVFTIKHRKQFVLVGRPDKRDKNESLLNEFGIHNEAYTAGTPLEDYISRNHVNYSDVDRILKERVQESSQYLTEGLSELCSKNY